MSAPQAAFSWARNENGAAAQLLTVLHDQQDLQLATAPE